MGAERLAQRGPWSLPELGRNWAGIGEDQGHCYCQVRIIARDVVSGAGGAARANQLRGGEQALR